jgi:hypothetical protein
MMDLDPEARRIVELARQARTPSAADKARVERRFALALGITAGAASAAASAQAASSVSAGKSAASLLALKWWGAGGGAVLAAALASYAALPSAQAPAAPAVFEGAEAVPRRSEAEPVAPQEVAPEQAPAPADHTEPERAPRPNRSRHTGAALAAELELLHGAQQAWRDRQATRALLLVEQHRSRYPRSTLRAERDALHVLALCELGRKADATRVARALLARDPRSPLRASIEQSCALK